MADLMTPSTNNVLDNIRLIYGSSIVRELLEFQLRSEPLTFQIEGFISHANFNMKKSVFLLFINSKSTRYRSFSYRLLPLTDR
jgi:DNA mismatch repair protein MLH1